MGVGNHAMDTFKPAMAACTLVMMPYLSLRTNHGICPAALQLGHHGSRLDEPLKGQIDRADLAQPR